MLRYSCLVVQMIFGLLLVECTGEKIESKNMEQIYLAEGVPVKVKPVKPGNFVTELRYHAILKGKEETSVYAPISDKIDQIKVRVGEAVKKDQILVTFPMDNPQTNYYQAKTSFENAQKSYERMETLYKSGGISQQDLDNARAAYDIAKANWDDVRQGVLVKSPIDGYLTQLNVQPSDNVKTDDLLLTVSQIRQLRAKIWLSEDEVAQVHTGCPVHTVWNGETFSGTVSEVDLALNLDTRAFGAVIILNNPSEKLRCGATVVIIVESYRNPKAVMTEQKNILNDTSGYYVFVAQNEKAVKKYVKTGRRNGLFTEITEGLSDDESLIVEGQLLLEPDKKIKIIQ